MPFDATPAVVADPTALYQERRERAAALWATIPVESWDMSVWGNECGTVGCALGWLAFKGVDGWKPGALSPSRYPNDHREQPRWGGIAGETAPARYFGLFEEDASDIFWTPWEKNAATVSAQLLAAPYVLPTE